jgi:hypothetical protein
MSPETVGDTGDLPRKARPLVAYLREHVRENGEVYVKSRFIAEEIDLSSKEIGSFMRRLQDGAAGLSVEKWAYTNGTTWLVGPA